MLVTFVKTVVVGLSYLVALVWVKPPIPYFTQSQLDRNIEIVVEPSPTPTPETAQDIDNHVLGVSNATEAAGFDPSPSPTPVEIVEQVPIEAEMETEFGKVKYNKIIKNVWAVSYDSTCTGCSDTTATGMKQGYGVVAVDPTVIPLYSKVYVPGYGIAVAGDVGGSVKGKIIDLGYDSLSGQWSARFVDVYLLAEQI